MSDLALLTTNHITDEQKDRIRAWVAALRSGRYQQGKNALRQPHPPGSMSLVGLTPDYDYCCLGVACDLFERSTMIGGLLMFRRWDNAVLPNAVKQWFGVDANPLLVPPSSNPAYLTHGARATRLNDTGVPFAIIADWIEATFLYEDKDVTRTDGREQTAHTGLDRGATERSLRAGEGPAAEDVMERQR